MLILGFAWEVLLVGLGNSILCGCVIGFSWHLFSVNHCCSTSEPGSRWSWWLQVCRPSVALILLFQVQELVSLFPHTGVIVSFLYAWWHSG